MFPRKMPVRRVLVVGAGAGALRLCQAAQELGIESQTAEGDSRTLLARALAGQCDAIHPGELAAPLQLELAKACGEAGVRFLGQGATLLAAMAQQRVMRRLMAEAGVPLASPEDGGTLVHLSLLVDGHGHVVYLAPRQSLGDAMSMAPLPWLTAERTAYLGRLAARGVVALGATGLVEAGFRVAGNALGFVSLRPGPAGEEALDEALFGLDPLVTHWRLMCGERLRERQSHLVGQGHARLWRLALPEHARLDGGPGVRLDHPGAGHEARLVIWGRRLEELEPRARRALSCLLGDEQAARLVPG
ncbi:hypothetical protein [Halomonas organivorans]|uniref:Biotin carboxylase n=1 Tax=Halomonas organivorans TaxID=257772 RepID=A0A7W5G4L1_9GAMM|nr:hypothetical protein [Halomonas organivorans]MBB3140090.1 biotin carboxylase [Halomonas organivorans]